MHHNRYKNSFSKLAAYKVLNLVSDLPRKQADRKEMKMHPNCCIKITVQQLPYKYITCFKTEVNTFEVYEEELNLATSP